MDGWSKQKLFFLSLLEFTIFLFCRWLEGVLTAFLGSPLPCLTVLQELHTPWPCGPSPGTCSIAGNWSFEHLVYCPVHCLCIWIPLMWDSAPVLLVMEELWAEFGPGQSDHCGSLDRQKCSSLSVLSPDPCALGYWGHWQGELPCSALVKVAINLTIWSPSYFEPEGTSVVAADLALTLVSSISLLALLAVTTSLE